MVKVMMACVAGCAFGAVAQTPCPDTNPPVNNTNCVTDAGFEELNVFNPVEPVGWHNISNPVYAKYRDIADSLTPDLFPVGTVGQLTPRTGENCVELKTSGFGGFVGFTTDTVNFGAPGFPYYDPLFDYSYDGDVLVWGYYMIPTATPLTGDYSFIKVNIKQGNQDVATFDHYSTSATDQIPGADAGVFYPPSITGTTNGEWVRFEFRIPRNAIVNQYECNRGIQVGCGCACVPAGTPNHIKITPSRFTGDGGLTGGTIFWDDIGYAQVPAVTSCYGACVADYDDGSGNGTPDGGVTIDDLIYYLGLFEAGDVCADVDDGSGTNTLDGGVTIDDLIYYLGRFEAGC